MVATVPMRQNNLLVEVARCIVVRHDVGYVEGTWRRKASRYCYC